MSVAFNLIDEKWIPCITTDGDFLEFNLREVLAQAHEIREICCETPIQSAAILPLLLAILHRNFGPANTREWGKLWGAGKFDMQTLDSYFDKWCDRFDLFHPKRPFYQVADDRVKKTDIHSGLAQTMKEHSILFTHQTKDNVQPLTPPESARILLQAQAFRVGGGVSGGKTPNHVHSIWTNTIVFFARGDNMFQTLMLNLIRYPDPNDTFITHTDQDRPFWERDDPKEGRTIGKKMLSLSPAGYLDYLTWQTNHVHLLPYETVDGVKVREVMIAPVAKFHDRVYCPQSCYMRGKQDKFDVLRFDPNKALWRDYNSLLPRDDDDKLPAVIRWCSRLSNYGDLAENHVIQLMATGMLVDPNRTGKQLFYREEFIRLYTSMLRNADLIAQVRNQLPLAEETSEKLDFALNVLADYVTKKKLDDELYTKNKNKEDKKTREKLINQWHANERYWIELEPRFWQFIKLLEEDRDQAIEQWQDDLKRTARDSLNHAINLASDSPWALKGSIAARRQLNIGLSRVFE